MEELSRALVSYVICERHGEGSSIASELDAGVLGISFVGFFLCACVCVLVFRPGRNKRVSNDFILEYGFF